MPSKFGYWKIRGLGQFIRLLLKYVEEDYEEKRYIAGPEAGEELPAGEENSDYEAYGKSWFQEKFKLGLDFPNTPYYKDDKVNISQSLTIMRYLARKYDLEAKTEEETVRQDLIAQQCYDCLWGFVMMCFEPNFNELKKEFRANGLPKSLQQFEDFLGDRPWMVGSYITWVDFCMFENLDRFRLFWPGIYDDYPKLKAFLDRFEALPQMTAYMQSDEYIKTMFFEPLASMVGRPWDKEPVQ